MVSAPGPWMDYEAVMTMKDPRKKAPQTAEEPRLSDWDRGGIGRAIRIEIPFTDLYKLREIADLLRGLAADIDFTARRTDHPPLDHKDYPAWRKSMLFYLREQSLIINKRIRELHGRHNKNGTTR